MKNVGKFYTETSLNGFKEFIDKNYEAENPEAHASACVIGAFKGAYTTKNRQVQPLVVRLGLRICMHT